MRQIVIPRIGGPEVLELREAPDPRPGAGEVLVDVEASGVNFADIVARMGLYPDAPPLPAVVGYEVAGRVAAVGDGTRSLPEGSPVIAMTRFGGYADKVVVPALQVVPIPEGLSFAEAAAIPVTYLTAWLCLVELGHLRAGHRVLVHAAAGGVGQAAVQICRAFGAEVIGTASASKHARLREAGVAHCIDYTTQDFEHAVLELTGGTGVDLVLDSVGGGSIKKSYRVLAPMGRLFMFGISALAPGKRRSLLAALRGVLAMPRFGAIRMMNENRGVFGVNLGHLWDRAEDLRRMLEAILARVISGELRPVVDRTFGFDEAGAAHAYLQDRKNFGKVVLLPKG
jgi:NADPH:quinone reductase-like Zn-dependent oxidoreductase